MESVERANAVTNNEGGAESTALRAIRSAGKSVLGPALAAVEHEGPAIETVASRIADAVVGDKKVFAFGAGHAQAFAMELTHRAGGLRFFVAMNLEDIRTEKRDSFWQLRDSEPERDPANAAKLLAHFDVQPGDVVLIASNSGRNGAIVEMALECVQRGVFVAGFTSVLHSSAFPSTHPSGKRLMDVAQVVVDNHCPAGDATVEIPGVGVACGSSTASFAVLAQMLNRATIDELLARNVEVTVAISANVR